MPLHISGFQEFFSTNTIIAKDRVMNEMEIMEFAEKH